MIGIFRTSIPGSSVAGVAAATAAQALFFTAVSVLMLIGVAVLLRRVSKGSPSDETGGFLASYPVLIPAVVVAAIVILIVLWPRLKPWLREQWRKGKQGLAIFSDWRRYASEVALRSGASYCCRIGVNVVFMDASLPRPGSRRCASRGRRWEGSIPLPTSGASSDTSPRPRNPCRVSSGGCFRPPPGGRKHPA
jgi:hypothetical protein